MECSLFGASLLFSVGVGTNPGLPAPQSLRAVHGWYRSLQRVYQCPPEGAKAQPLWATPPPGTEGPRGSPYSQAFCRLAGSRLGELQCSGPGG